MLWKDSEGSGGLGQTLARWQMRLPFRHISFEADSVIGGSSLQASCQSELSGRYPRSAPGFGHFLAGCGMEDAGHSPPCGSVWRSI